ncbi:MAG: DNA polymerase III subunit delta, partial [Candidatus Omnitrophica bacterium]|nr:DNA polymerase III subunit delta [Candidatus Omnitrophota bacterium]
LIRDIHLSEASSLKTISEYLSAPTDTGILIMTADGAFVKTSPYREIAGKTTEIKVDVPRGAELKQRIRAFLKREQVSIDDDAVELIIELKGNDPAGIRIELEKLAVFGKGERVTAQDVRRLVGRSITEEVFALVDSIEANDAGKVYRVLEDQRDARKQPVETIGYLSWHIKGIQKALKLAGEGRATEDALAAEMKCKPWAARKILARAKKYDIARVDKWLRTLLEADTAIKTGKYDGKLALELMVVNLMK